MPRSALQAQQTLNQFAQKNERNPAFHAMNFIPATKHVLQAAAKGNEVESRQVYAGYLNSINAHKARTHTLLKAVKQLGSVVETKKKLESLGFKHVAIQKFNSRRVGYLKPYSSIKVRIGLMARRLHYAAFLTPQNTINNFHTKSLQLLNFLLDSKQLL